ECPPERQYALHEFLFQEIEKNLTLQDRFHLVGQLEVGSLVSAKLIRRVKDQFNANLRERQEQVEAERRRLQQEKEAPAAAFGGFGSAESSEEPIARPRKPLPKKKKRFPFFLILCVVVPVGGVIFAVSKFDSWSNLASPSS